LPWSKIPMATLSNSSSAGKGNRARKTRAVTVVTDQEGVEAFRVTNRLSDSDTAVLMGESLTRVSHWAPSHA
jgi:hypothetical protein